MVALTSATQTELDSLSATEIITKQFNTDHPHVTKLHKRTDNDSKFSSHSTPEIEKLICQRVRFLYFYYLTFIVYYTAGWH